MQQQTKKSTLKKVLGIASYVVVGILVVLIFVSVFAKITGDKNTSLLGVSIYKVVTGSMEPEIMTGELVLVRKINPDKLEVGDVVTFMDGRKVITHKIISIEGDKVTTKGVANASADSPITKEDVLGKVFFHSVALGKIYDFLTGAFGFMIVVMLPLLIFAGYEIYNIFYHVDVLKREKQEALAQESEAKQNKGSKSKTEPEPKEDLASNEEPQSNKEDLGE